METTKSDETTGDGGNLPGRERTTRSRTGGLFPLKFTLTIEEHPTLGWVVTTDAHKGFMQTIMPEEGLPEGLRQTPGMLREILVAQIDADRERRGQSPK